MNVRVSKINNAIKTYDRELFCEPLRDGTLAVFRRTTRYETYEIEPGVFLTCSLPNKWFVFALTDNWQTTGKEVSWGIEPIMKRLRDMDCWNKNVVGDLINSYEKRDESRDRDIKNHTEAFARYELRDSIKKMDVNTSILEKKDKRREYDKRIKL